MTDLMTDLNSVITIITITIILLIKIVKDLFQTTMVLIIPFIIYSNILDIGRVQRSTPKYEFKQTINEVKDIEFDNEINQIFNRYNKSKETGKSSVLRLNDYNQIEQINNSYLSVKNNFDNNRGNNNNYTPYRTLDKKDQPDNKYIKVLLV